MVKIEEERRILVVGLGHVGQPLAALLAEAGFIVYGVDNNPQTIAQIRNGNSHVREEGLSELLAKHLNVRLVVGPLDRVDAGGAEAIVITVESVYQKSRKLPALISLKKATACVSSILKRSQLVVVRTTVPIGTTRRVVAPILEESGLRAGIDFGLAYCPERTVEGAALKELRRTPQIIGAVDEQSGQCAKAVFESVTEKVVRVSSLEAAEAIKLIDNAYRDTRFAFANTIAEICERLGLNAWELIRAANLEYPRNSIPTPSPGVGGSCIPKDARFLTHSAASLGSRVPLIAAARKVNEDGPKRLATRLKKLVSMKGTTIFIAGFAFKGAPETGDMRESPTLALLEELKHRGARITGYDPAVGPDRLVAMGVVAVETLEAGLNPNPKITQA